MGATLGFIYKQPPRPDDADNPARLGWGVPMPAFREDFETRFGVRLMEGYGATECGCPVWQFPGERYPAGSCGRSHPEYELFVVNEGDEVLPAGETGEIVVRPRHPDMVMKGYFRDPAANARIFRIAGAVCMGDRGRLDEQGNLFFEGRRSDAIRRRGENISAAEIEDVIDRHPAVLEVAALGVPSEHGEDDVAVAIVLKTGDDLDQAGLLKWCEGRLARHMLPEVVRFIEALPKTPTRKILRDKIREDYFRN
jgi:crotonobetaine/carnitine-CoA ligase